MRLGRTIALALVSARATGVSGTGDNLPMNFSYNQGKLLGMTDDGLLTWLDRAAAVSLGIVLYLRIRRLPRFYHLAVALLLWATCDILYGNLSRPLYVRLHSLWHVSIWTYVAQIPRD